MLNRTLAITDSSGRLRLNSNGQAALRDFPTRARVDFDLTPTAYLLPTAPGAHPGIGPYVQGNIQFSAFLDISCYTIDYTGDPASFDFQSVINDCPFETIHLATPCFNETISPVGALDVLGPATTINNFAVVLRCYLFYGYDVVNQTFSAFVIPRLQDNSNCGGYGLIYDWNADYSGSSPPWLGKYVTGLGPRDQVVFDFPNIPPPSGMLSSGGVSEYVGTVAGTVTLTPLCDPCVIPTTFVQPPCGCEPVSSQSQSSASSESSSSSSQNHTESQSSLSSNSSSSSSSLSSRSSDSSSSRSSNSSNRGVGSSASSKSSASASSESSASASSGSTGSSGSSLSSNSSHHRAGSSSSRSSASSNSSSSKTSLSSPSSLSSLSSLSSNSSSSSTSSPSSKSSKSSTSFSSESSKSSESSTSSVSSSSSSSESEGDCGLYSMAVTAQNLSFQDPSGTSAAVTWTGETAAVNEYDDSEYELIGSFPAVASIPGQPANQPISVTITFVYSETENEWNTIWTFTDGTGTVWTFNQDYIFNSGASPVGSYYYGVLIVSACGDGSSSSSSS